MVTRGGMCINAKNEIPVQKRIAGGVRGINLKEGDEVIFASQIHEEGEIVTVTADGSSNASLQRRSIRFPVIVRAYRSLH